MNNSSALRLRKVAEAEFPTQFGVFRIHGFEGSHDGLSEEAVVLEMGNLADGPPPLVRIHSQCLTGDVFHSLRCDCRAQLEISLRSVAEEGRGIGLLNKLRAYELQDRGADTVEANERLGFDPDLRSYLLPGAILRHFGLKAVRLLSNNPEKVAAVENAGVEVTERVPCLADVVETREAYLRTKKEKMGHLLE